MSRSQVLLERQPVTKSSVTRYGANPIFPVEPFPLKVRRQKPVINVENKVELPVFRFAKLAFLPSGIEQSRRTGQTVVVDGGTVLV